MFVYFGEAEREKRERKSVTDVREREKREGSGVVWCGVLREKRSDVH